MWAKGLIKFCDRSGHHVHRDRPDLVASAILSVLAAAQVARTARPTDWLSLAHPRYALPVASAKQIHSQGSSNASQTLPLGRRVRTNSNITMANRAMPWCPPGLRPRHSQTRLPARLQRWKQPCQIPMRKATPAARPAGPAPAASPITHQRQPAPSRGHTSPLRPRGCRNFPHGYRQQTHLPRQVHQATQGACEAEVLKRRTRPE